MHKLLLFVCLSCGLVSAPLLNLLAHFSTKRPKFGGAHKGQPKGQAELRDPNLRTRVVLTPPANSLFGRIY